MAEWFIESNDIVLILKTIIHNHNHDQLIIKTNGFSVAKQIKYYRKIIHLFDH